MPKRIKTNYIKSIEEHELRELFQAASAEYHKEIWLSITSILTYMGLRCAEVCNLKWADIRGDYDKFIVHDVKNGDVRERIIPDKIKAQLKVYEFSHRRFQRVGIYIFEPPKQSGSKNIKMNPASIAVKFRQWRRKYGLGEPYYQRQDKFHAQLNRVTPHTLRHYFLSAIYSKSKNLIEVSRLIGHRNIRTTERYIYTEKLKERERELVNAI